MRPFHFFSIILLILSHLILVAHGDMHEQIQELTKQLEKQPENAVLYVQRGLLWQAHGSYIDAKDDFQKALNLNENLHLVHLHLGQAYLGQEKPDSALFSIQSYIAHFPNNAVGLLTRGEAYFDLEKYDLSAKDYETAIGLKGEKAAVQDYMSWAEAEKLTGGDAVACLEQGMDHLGNLITLQQKALDYEIQAQQYDQAVSRIETVLNGLQRKEVWLVKKAEVLLLAGDNVGAKEALEQAKFAIEYLKPRAKNTEAMKRLMSRIGEMEKFF